MKLKNDMFGSIANGKNLFALIDTAQIELSFYKELKKNNEIVFRALFENTPDESSSFAGPALISLEKISNSPSATLNNLLVLQQEKPVVVWFLSEQSVDYLFGLFQSMLYAKLPDSKLVLCRFYDSRCLESFLNFYKMKDLNLYSKLSNNIPNWAFWANNNYKLLNIEEMI